MNEDPELKMWLAVRQDITMPAEKLAVQSGHAFAETILRAHEADPDLVARYRATSHAKIVVRAKNLNELERVRAEAEAAGVPCTFIVDEGRTIFNEPTATVCAFGPSLRGDLPAFLRRLRVMETKPKPKPTEEPIA